MSIAHSHYQSGFLLIELMLASLMAALLVLLLLKSHALTSDCLHQIKVWRKTLNTVESTINGFNLKRDRGELSSAFYQCCTCQDIDEKYFTWIEVTVPINFNHEEKNIHFISGIES